MCSEDQNRPDKAMLLDLLKLKLDHQQKFFTDLAKTASVFLLILGVMLKFALDENATPTLRHALAALAICMCVLGFIVCYLAERLRISVDEEVAQLNAKLGTPLTNVESLTLKYAARIGMGIGIVIVMGFSSLFFI